MCDCDCELTKYDRWAQIRAESKVVIEQLRADVVRRTRERTETSKNFTRALDLQIEARTALKAAETRIAELEQQVINLSQLQERSDQLSRLEAAGVDNWEGYSEAFADEEDECTHWKFPGAVCRHDEEW